MDDGSSGRFLRKFARARGTADEGQSVRWGPRGVVRVVASADACDGAFSMVETTEPPGSAAHGERRVVGEKGADVTARDV